MSNPCGARLFWEFHGDWSPAAVTRELRANLMRLIKIPASATLCGPVALAPGGRPQRLGASSALEPQRRRHCGALWVRPGRTQRRCRCSHPLRRNAKGYFLSSGRSEVLRRNGYDVLLFDFNGLGESSQGDFNYVEGVLAAARYARRRAGGLPVHALAVCFGAVWTLCAATREAPFDGIAVEAPLTSLHDYYARDPLAKAFLRLLWHVFPRSAAGASPLESARRLAGMPRLLVIAGFDDTITPIGMSRRLYEACTLPQAARSIWSVAGAEHLRAFEAAPSFFAGASSPLPSIN